MSPHDGFESIMSSYNDNLYLQRATPATLMGVDMAELMSLRTELRTGMKAMQVSHACLRITQRCCP